MGTRLTRVVSFCCVLLLSCNVFAGSSVVVETAQQMLKDYALVTCLKKIETKESNLTEDLGRSIGALHFMGQGKHQIQQNEDTFEVIHDPYQATATFLRMRSEVLKGYMKNGELSESLGCIRAYNSVEFSEFIVTQDEYIH